MLQRFQSPGLGGGFTPSPALVLASVVLLGTAVRDSSSDSLAVTAATPGSRSLGRTLTTGGSIELGPVNDSRNTIIGEVAGLRKPDGATAPAEEIHSLVTAVPS